MPSIPHPPSGHGSDSDTGPVGHHTLPIVLLGADGAAAGVLRQLRHPLRRCRSLPGLARLLPRGVAVLIVNCAGFDRIRRSRLLGLLERQPETRRPSLLLLASAEARALAAECRGLTATVLPVGADLAPCLELALALARQRQTQQQLELAHHHQTQQLRVCEERLRVALKHSPLVVAHVNTDLRYQWIHNPHPDFIMKRIVGRRVDAVGPAGSGRRVARLKRQVLETGQGLRTEIRFPSREGERFYDVVIEPLHDESGAIIGATSAALDITERKQLQQQLYREAFHDRLTGLPNRALFLDRLQQAMDRARRQHSCYAVLIIDLDNFKVVNDSLGHLFGDELLVKVARRVGECLRPGDTLARFGGDEFTVLLQDIRAPAAVGPVVERIQRSLRHVFSLHGYQVHTGASIGIAMGDQRYACPDDVLRDADTALYQAKAQGKDCHAVFDEPMRALALSRLRLESQLREAIRARRLVVHYQPIVCVKSRAIVGCEALLRWDDPVLGAISPTDFIPVAEETGLILQLGQQVLETAAADLAGWLAQGVAPPAFYVSVNLSTRQFAHRDLGCQVLAVLERNRLSGRNLRLEITESAMMRHESQASGILAELRARGVQICVDDFGTGYSSLSYLQRFPIDVLKVDKSFVHGVGSQPVTREIVRSVVRLASGLNTEAIAEGVENEEHLEQLSALGFRRAQGFLFHSALAADELARQLGAARRTPRSRRGAAAV